MTFPQEHSTSHGHTIVVDKVDEAIQFLYQNLEVARLVRSDGESEPWELVYPDGYASALVGGEDEKARIANAIFQISIKLTREQTEAHAQD